ncbi:MAG: methyltransferase, partial [Myxococcota bacterium]
IGPIGWVAARRGAASVTAVDHDAIAVRAAAHNLPGADVRCVDHLPAGVWDLVLSNPPIHRGVDVDWTVVERMAVDLPSRLAPGGRAVVVTQATVPIPRLFAGQAVGVVATDRRFTVWSIARAGAASSG